MITLRFAKETDAEELLGIYAPYVRETAITFEYDVPDIDEFRKRIRETLLKYPYIVAEKDGKIAGYAYAGAFKSRAAYDWAVETSIYVKRGMGRSGIGKKLYCALENVLRVQNILNVNACIAYPETEDEYLTKNSVQFHEHLGYKYVGRFNKCGFKFGRWYDMVWLEKFIGEHSSTPEKVRWFAECDKNKLQNLLEYSVLA